MINNVFYRIKTLDTFECLRHFSREREKERGVEGERERERGRGGEGEEGEREYRDRETRGKVEGKEDI